MHSDGDGGAPLPAVPTATSKIDATVMVAALTTHRPPTTATTIRDLEAADFTRPRTSSEWPQHTSCEMYILTMKWKSAGDAKGDADAQMLTTALDSG
jgi:hypothetical protein